MTELPPELVIVSDTVFVPPTCTLPNVMLDGLPVKDPALTPVPESVTFALVPVVEDDTEMLPDTAPEFVGLKVMVKGRLWPAATVAGRFRPLIENPAPVAVACEIVRLVPPLFVMVAV